MKFFEVAKSFDAIEQVSSRIKMTELLANLFKRATPVEAETIAYLSLGNLNPMYVGTQFNLAEKSLAKVVAQLLHQSQAEVTKRAKKCGDMGLVAEEGRWRHANALTVSQVNRTLHAIHDIAGIGSQEAKEQALLSLLEDLDSLSAKYVVRIVIGKLRLGFSDMTLLDAFSWMAVGDKSLRKDLEEAYNVTADIGHMIKTLKDDGIEHIRKIHVVPGIPLRPAAAERMPSAAAIMKKLGPCVAQPKIDGFRLQVHLHDGRKKNVTFFSRNLQDMSAMFPDLANAVTKLKVKDMIAEGEAVAYDPETDTFLPFQETVKRKRKHGIEQAVAEFPLKLFFFDLLYVNGKVLLDKTHKERRKELLNIVPKPKDTAKAVVSVIEEETIKTTKELEKYFNAHIAAGLEGLVVKKPDAVYEAGKRNFNWIKLKREESGHLKDTVDCVVLGYYAGHGKRASFGIGAFLVGVRNAKKDIFQTIAKIGTGLTDAGWKELKKKCDKISVKNKPKNVECAKELYPDVWMPPELVCAIRADEITISPVHGAGASEKQLGFALRFPRMMGYREDKSSSDATTVKEVERLYEIQFKKGRKKKVRRS